MSFEKSVVAVFNTHTDAEAAIKEIQKAGFNMKNLSIIGKDFHSEEHVVGYYNSGDRIKFWGKLGAFWGGIWGLLAGSAFFFIPGVGPVMIFGPLVGWVFSALEGAVIVGGLSAIGAGLYGMGIPQDSVVQYEGDIKSGKFLLVAHGTAAEIARIEVVIAKNSVSKTHVHAVEQVGAK